MSWVGLRERKYPGESVLSSERRQMWLGRECVLEMMVLVVMMVVVVVVRE